MNALGQSSTSPLDQCLQVLPRPAVDLVFVLAGLGLRLAACLIIVVVKADEQLIPRHRLTHPPDYILDADDGDASDRRH
jgi:hypothetical protein